MKTPKATEVLKYLKALPEIHSWGSERWIDWRAEDTIRLPDDTPGSLVRRAACAVRLYNECGIVVNIRPPTQQALEAERAGQAVERRGA